MRRLAVRALKTARLSKIAHRVYYGYVHGFATSNPHVLPALDRVLAQIEADGTEGDYLEFGVFKGYAFWHAQNVAHQLGLDQMRFFGFDSFAGLPEPQGVDRTPWQEFYEGQYHRSKERVTTHLDAAGVDWTKTFLIEGYYKDSLTPETRRQHSLRRAAMVLIDCDLYESARDALAFIAPLVDEGTTLMFDDWDAFLADDSKGERRAFREFLHAHREFEAEEWFAYGHYSRVFVLRRRSA
jgi:O-methyltransferase